MSSLDVKVKGLEGLNSGMASNLPPGSDGGSSGGGGWIGPIMAKMDEIVQAIRENTRQIVDAVNSQTESLLEDFEQKQVTEPEEKQKNGFLKALEQSKLVEKTFEAARGLVTTTDSNAFIGQGFGFAGGLLGTLGSSLTSVPFVGSAIESVVGAAGDAIERSIRAREELFNAEAGFYATTGGRFGRSSLSQLRAGDEGGFRFGGGGFRQLGLTSSEAAELGLSVSEAAGTGAGARENVLGLATGRRGLGVEEGTTLQLIRQGRFTEQGGVLQQLSNTLLTLQKNGIISEGDRALFSELLDAENQLVDFLGQTAERVDRQAATGLIAGFSGLGGRFSAGDPRSTGLIQNVVSSVSQPGSDVQQALQLEILRPIAQKQFGGGSIFDVLQLQEEIGNNPELLQEVISGIKRFSGGGTEGAISTAKSLGIFEGLSIRDLRRLFEGDITDVEQVQGTEEDIRDIRNSAASLVSLTEVNNTRLTDAFVESVGKGLAESTDIAFERFSTAGGQIVDELMARIQDMIKQAAGFDFQAAWKKLQDFFEKAGKFFDSVVDFFSDPSKILQSIGTAIGNAIYDLLPDALKSKMPPGSQQQIQGYKPSNTASKN